MRPAFAIFALFIVTAPARAQLRDNRDTQLSCTQRGVSDRARACDMREVTMAPFGRLDVQPGRNGGVTIKGWAQSSVLVRARLEAWANNDTDARSLLSQIRLDAAAGQIRAVGPDPVQSQNWNDWQGWTVGLEIFAPWNTDLKLETHNGGINLSDLRGRIEFESHNGGVHLTRVSGDVTGGTHNGAIQVELAGTAFEGRQLDLNTHNGGVTLSLPASFSARVEAHTDRGRVDSDFPITTTGRINRGDLNFNLGAGGPPIRITTHNGRVMLRKMN